MAMLSKSSFIRGKQCELSLYLLFNYKRLNIPRDEPDFSKFESGNKVGRLAQMLFPDGIDTGFEAAGGFYLQAVESTKEAIADDYKVIYEAAFMHDDCLSIMDIIVKNGNKWDLYEVKSSNSVKEYYYFDAAFQYRIIKNNGIKINKIHLIHLDRDYVRKGKLDIKKLFHIEDITDIVVDLQKDIKDLSDRYKKIINSVKMPALSIGKQCTGEPANPCDFYTYCWKNIPEYSVFNISRISEKAFILKDKGILNVDKIPEEFILTPNQLIEVKCYRENKPYIQKEKLKDFLDTIEYPIFFLDFETYMSAIPEFDETRPWQMIPFQFSIHCKKNKKSNIEHISYLAELKGDPRPELIKQLIKHLKGKGSIVAYNSSFEQSRINELVRDFPEFKKELDDINSRMIDLCIPFRQKYYYMPEMQSSASLKSVLPAVCPELSYDQLEIADGGTASSEFVRCRNLSDKKEIKKIRDNLLKYCEMDTYAMVKILDKLKELVKL